MGMAIAQAGAPENPLNDRCLGVWGAESRNGTKMTDKTLSFTLPEAQRDRLAALAEREDKTFQECLRQAVEEYLETWEAYHRTVEALEEGDSEDLRPYLRAVND